MTIKICVSISPQTANEAINLIEKAEKNRADFIEVRLDVLKDCDRLADIAQCSHIHMIATNKSLKDHGYFLGNESEKQQTLTKAAENGFKYVDVDLLNPQLQNITNKLSKTDAKIIISFHDFNKTPSIARMNQVLEQEIASGADICKIVTTATIIEDNLTMLEFVSSEYKKAKLVSFAMGELGKTSRLLSPIFGAHFTIASLEKKRETAPGQLTIQEMRNIYQKMGQM